MKYFIACPCGKDLYAEAAGDDEAVHKITTLLEEHSESGPGGSSPSSVHPDTAGMSQEQKHSLVRSRLQKQP